MSKAPRRLKVLLIDDSRVAADFASAVLESTGFEFNVVLTTWSPDIVLTDVNMPGVTGPELCQWIKQRVDTKGVPVVLFSDMPDAQLSKLAETAGADAYVSKEHGIERVSVKLSELCENILW
jgi:CheY-like chemotaxis protein